MIARILIVDDDAAFRASLRTFLESRHHQVLEASDGSRAFVLAEQEMPHLIIMDIVMPGLYGSAASKKLQDYWRTSHIPIIILSGASHEPVRLLIDTNPNIRFLRKPVDLGALDEAIHALLPKGGILP